MNRSQERGVTSEWQRLTVTARGGSVRIFVHVRPKSSRCAILGVREGALDIALTSPPADGAANAELQKLVARALRVTHRDITIVAGTSSRNKVLEINGVNVDDTRSRLSSARR